MRVKGGSGPDLAPRNQAGPERAATREAQIPAGNMNPALFSQTRLYGGEKLDGRDDFNSI